MGMRHSTGLIVRTIRLSLLVMLLIGISLGPLAPQRVDAATLTVTNTNDSGAGSLRQTIANAAAGDIIVFAPSLEGQTITLTSGQLSINKRLTIVGPGPAKLTVRGNNTYRVFNIGTQGVVAISGLTIAEGYGKNTRGGGIYNAGSLTLNNCVISRNTIDGTLLATLGLGGAGIYNTGTLTIMNCTLSDNQDKANSAGGGAIYNDTKGKLTLQTSTVSGNAVRTIALFGQYGGGGICNRGTMTITQSIISDNTASGFSYGGGGGIYNDGVATLVSSTVRGNKSARLSTTIAEGGMGGGIVNWSNGKLLAERSTLAANIADRDGGGIINAGIVTFTQSTISGNRALGVRAGRSIGTGGGGLANVVGTATLLNSTVSGNSGGPYGGGILNDKATLHLTFTTLSDNQALAGGVGAGIYASGYPTNTFMTFTNVIIANSVGGSDCVSEGPSITSVGTLIEDNSCGCTMSGDPALGPLQNNGGETATHALLEGSIAIDAADCIAEVAADQRGVARPQGARCDIGAYESP